MTLNWHYTVYELEAARVTSGYIQSENLRTNWSQSASQQLTVPTIIQLSDSFHLPDPTLTHSEAQP